MIKLLKDLKIRMKRFKHFLREQQREEPLDSRGVISHNGRIFVGVNHGVTPKLNADTNTIIQNAMKQNGYYHEGNGGDAEALKPLTGKHKYNGSWDDKIESDLHSDKNGNVVSPHYHMNRFFGNSPDGTKKSIEKLTNPNATIRNTLHNNRNFLFSDKKNGSTMSHNEMEKFFDNADEETQKHGDMPATKENLQKFVDHGNKQIWDGNDVRRDTPLGNMAHQDQVKDREGWLINHAPTGVYYIGSGHIPSIAKQLERGSYTMIGGSHAHL